MPIGSDPVLAKLPERERGYVQAELDFSRYHFYLARGQRDSATAFLDRFRALIGAGKDTSQE